MSWSSDWKMAIVFIAIIINAYIWNKQKEKEPKPEHKGWHD